MKSKTTAAILAIFLGGIGIHRFYLGQTGYGILYLIFCWTLIPSLISFIDFIIFITMDEQVFNGKYNKGNVVVEPSKLTMNTADELEKLYMLKEKGVLTESEFLNRKSKLL